MPVEAARSLLFFRSTVLFFFFNTTSPVINRWVPVLQQGLITTAPGGASSGGYASENEKLHWSGLHVALQVRRMLCHTLVTRVLRFSYCREPSYAGVSRTYPFRRASHR